MADIKKYAPFLEATEGGYVNDPHDSGGATNKGITLKLWKEIGYDKNSDGVIDKFDVMRITSADFIMVLQKEFWNKCGGNLIINQAIANLIVDWFYNSGYKGLIHVQHILGLKEDGVIGNKTITKINNFYSQKRLFKLIWKDRLSYLKSLRGWKYYKNGWTDRMNRIQYNKLIYTIPGTKKKVTINF